LLGRKRMFVSGLALFTGASLACGLADGPAALIGARFAQGVGAALVSSVTLGMIVALYEEQQGRARAIAAYSFVGAAGASIGLVLGGVLTEAIGWHWIFFVNVPIGLAAGVSGLRLLPGDRGAGLAGGADGAGAVLVTAGLMTGIATLVGTAQHGWLSGYTLAGAAVAAVLIGGFVWRQATATEPLLRLGVFTSRAVSGANLVQILVIAAAFGFQVMIALYLQRVLGYSPAEAGLGLLPTAVVIGAVSLGLSARLAERLGERTVLVTGLVLVTTGLALLTGVPVHGSYMVHLLAALVIFGLGGGLTLPALATLGMSDATPADAGVVSGLFNTTQQAGAAIGVALLSTLAAEHASTLRGDGLGTIAALTGGYRLSFGVGAGLSVAALAVAVAFMPGGKRGRLTGRKGSRKTVSSELRKAAGRVGDVPVTSACHAESQPPAHGAVPAREPLSAG
jgi:MFS family permease